MEGLKKYQKMMFVFLAVIVIITLISSGERYRVERNNTGVDLIIDYKSLQSLVDIRESEGIQFFNELKSAGLNGVAVYENNVETLITEGKAHLLTGEDIDRLKFVTGNVTPVIEYIGKNYDLKGGAVLISDDNGVIDKLKTLAGDWKERYNTSYNKINGQAVIYFPDWKDSYLNLSVGFDRNMVSVLEGMNLKVIPRVSNNLPLEKSIPAWLNPDYIIFEGQEVTGYPGDLDNTVSFMQEENIKFGMIEPFIAYQKGAVDLAHRLNYDVIRVHSIQQEEMAKYSLNKVVNRYLRAVRERNVRILYLKPVIKESVPEKDLLQVNRLFIKTLSAKLVKSGYQPGKATPFNHFKTSRPLLILTGIGVILGFILLLTYLFPHLDIKLILYSGIIMVGGDLILTFLLPETLFRQLLALGASIVFPVLAVISQLLAGDSSQNLMVRYVKTTCITLIGALFVVTSLARTSFLLKVDQFRGVKISFLLPLLIIVYYYIREYIYGDKKLNWMTEIANIMDKNIKVKHIFYTGLLVLGGLVYIGRTGNYPFLPVPPWELILRERLEKLLYVRPRFKEFLIGHPFLYLGLFLKNRVKPGVMYLIIVVLASIGQVTVINTFGHTHTPLIISLIRVVHGLWLGLLIGIILAIACKWVYNKFIRPFHN
ncbi:DUF5693 family protein [Halothermothrix orenii]|uniref:Uncharacterized protein n=1 Tax=Halothermothrix orenii (strain H 168 / OCM 544 / DSM 9562) TaxID=373903 RepID=B8CYM1_HALOH|nr:DUF5693 family protein [Halothermothrix orenii]ACL70390.1 hypothetical protein Hore_16410 [Halothermothrix orenii H 168]